MTCAAVIGAAIAGLPPARDSAGAAAGDPAAGVPVADGGGAVAVRGCAICGGVFGAVGAAGADDADDADGGVTIAAAPSPNSPRHTAIPATKDPDLYMRGCYLKFPLRA